MADAPEAVVRLSFSPSGAVTTLRPGEALLEACNRMRVPLGQSCSGLGICGWCKVRIVSGLENVPPPGEREQSLRERRDYAADERVACLTVPAGDVVIGTRYW